MNSEFSVFDDAKRANFASFHKNENKPENQWVDVTMSVEHQWDHYPIFGAKKEKEFLFRVNEIGLPHGRAQHSRARSPMLIHGIPIGVYSKIYWTLVGVEVQYELRLDRRQVSRHYRAFAPQESWRREELIPYIERRESDRAGKYGIFLEMGLPIVQGKEHLGLPGMIFDEGKNGTYALNTHPPLISERAQATTQKVSFMDFTFEATLVSDRYEKISIDYFSIRPLFARFDD